MSALIDKPLPQAMTAAKFRHWVASAQPGSEVTLWSRDNRTDTQTGDRWLRQAITAAIASEPVLIYWRVDPHHEPVQGAYGPLRVHHCRARKLRHKV